MNPTGMDRRVNFRLISICYLNPFKPNGISHYNQLDYSFSFLTVVGWYFSFSFNFQLNIPYANSGDPDQTPRSVASDLGHHCCLCLTERTPGLNGLMITFR